MNYSYNYFKIIIQNLKYYKYTILLEERFHHLYLNDFYFYFLRIRIVVFLINCCPAIFKYIIFFLYLPCTGITEILYILRVTIPLHAIICTYRKRGHKNWFLHYLRHWLCAIWDNIMMNYWGSDRNAYNKYKIMNWNEIIFSHSSPFPLHKLTFALNNNTEVTPINTKNIINIITELSEITHNNWTNKNWN